MGSPKGFDDLRWIAGQSFGCALLESFFVQSESLRSWPVVECFLGSRIADQQRHGGG